jgi:hypothetical protein
LTGAVDPWLGVDAALRLARSDASFGALFDGSSGDLDPFAFRCGGALFEIEQIRS